MFLIMFCLFNDCLDKPFKAMAKEIVAGIDSGRVIVANFVNIEGSERRLGVYLATRMSNYLFEKTKKRKQIEVRDRQWGKRLTLEELQYSRAIPLDEYNKKMQANIAVCGRYALRSNELEIIELKAMTTPGATNISQAKNRIIRLKPEDYEWLNKYGQERLPTPISQEELYFLCEPGGHKGLIKKIEVVDRNKEPINKDSIPIGEFIKLKIDLDTLPVYLYIFGWHRGKDETGKEDTITLLYPNNFEPQNPVTRKSMIIPTADDYAFEAVAPSGYNWIRVIASVNPIAEIVPMSQFGPKDPILQNFNKALKALDKNTWQGIYVELWMTE